MKQIELKDLSYCKIYTVAYKKKDNTWIPTLVKVKKEYTIKLIKPEEIDFSPLIEGEEYSIKDFFHSYLGKDIFGHKIYGLNVFESMRKCSEWCKFENRLIGKYEE